jgi:hypothetical protein
MATFTWTLIGTAATNIQSDHEVKFAGAAFGTPITVGSWNDTTHVSSGATDVSSGNSPKNCKFISTGGGGGGDSQMDIGGGTVDIDTATTGDAPIVINFSDASSVSTSSTTFYADDGSTPANKPVNVSFHAAEVTDTLFTQATGSANGLTLSDQGAATSHDFYILLSASPDAVGEQTSFRLRIELTYS